MPARTVTYHPTTQNRTEIVVSGERRAPAGWTPFERTMYAQDAVQAQKAPRLFLMDRRVTVRVVGPIARRSRHA